MSADQSGKSGGENANQTGTSDSIIEEAISKNQLDQVDSQSIKDYIQEKKSHLHELQHQLRKQKFDFKTLMELANQINARSLDTNGLESFTHYIRSTLRGHFGVKVVYLIHPQYLHGGPMRMVGENEEEGYILELGRKDPIVRLLKKQKEPVPLNRLIEETGPSPELETMKDLDVELVMPLLKETPRFGEEIQGVLMLGPKMLENSYSESEKQFLMLLGSMIAISLHNAELHQKSITDSLTGLFSRGHFDLQLEAEIARMGRKEKNEEKPSKNKFSVILMDIDHFKEFNDTYGHQTGDKILKTLSTTLQNNLRKSDVVARYGGEEFVVIAPETDRERGTMIGNRLRKAVEDLTVTSREGEELSVTISGGVSTYPTNGEDARSLVTAADEALYLSKEKGRNRIIHASSETMQGNENTLKE